MNPIAKNALKRAMSARLALPTSVLDEPEDVPPTAAVAPAPALALVKEVKPMPTVTPIRPRKPARATYTSRNADKFVIRLPEGLRDRIQGYSRRQFCSMNSFILKTVIKEIDRLDKLDGVEPLAAGQLVTEEAGAESMEALVVRLEAAVARMEKLQQ